MTERILRAEKVKDGIMGGKAWLTLTNERLVFTSNENLGRGEKWSAGLEFVESVRAKKAFRAGTEVLEVFFRNRKGKRDHKSFERLSFGALANFGSGTHRAEQNSFAAFESQIIAAREALVHRADMGADTSTASAARPASPREGVEALERLFALHSSGALTDEEFRAAKGRLLGL